MAWKGNLQRETESFLIAAENNVIRTNQIKARIHKTQQNSKCRLCGDRDKTVNHMLSECSKLAQKETKSRHDCVGKVNHWEMYKEFQFDHTNKWYMKKPSISLGEWHTSNPMGLWHTNGSLNLGQTNRHCNNQQKKENLQNCRLCCPSWSQKKAEIVKRKISSWTLQGNWFKKTYGTWKWQLYKLWLVLLVQSPNDY